ncbi:MAG: UvrD-helicase domain-containing protein [bacterium]
MEFPHILVISASAGAGKTMTLSERYIKFLISPEIKTSARNILAITFTNKAAGEMKERIIFDLKKMALGDSKNKELAEKKLNELLDNYSDFKVQTIDSFLTSVTTASALELGIPPHFEIEMSSSQAFNFALDELLSQVYHNSPLEAIFLNFVDELLHINSRITWNIKNEILTNISSLRKLEVLKGLKVKRVCTSEDIKKLRTNLIKDVEGFCEMGKEKVMFNTHFKRAVDNFRNDAHYQPWESKMFLKDAVNEICNKGSIITPSHQKIWQEIRQGISSLAEMTAHCRFAPFIDIISHFDEGVDSFKKHMQIIFIEDLNILLNTFLENEGAVPEVYFHLGDRIAHFFIDEFQDTSRSQWQTLFPLIEEALSKTGSLFYVGDKKQAIFGFRGGESALFDEAKANFPSVEKEKIKEEFPEINYRSRENIVEFVNNTFCQENLSHWAEEVKLSIPFETYLHSQQKSKEKFRGGYVRIESIDEPLDKDELYPKIEQYLVDVIQNKIIHRFSPGEVTILVRTNDEASWVTRVLTGAGIAVASEMTLDISSHHLIQEIVCFLKFLNSPIDNLSFAGFLQGDIFLKASGLTHFTIYSFLLKNRIKRKALYTLFRDEFPEVWESHLENYFQMVGFLPPYDLVSKILKGYNVFQEFPNEEGFFFQLLEVLKNTEVEGENSLKSFLARWNKDEEEKKDFQVVLPGYANAIRVMTIHKAKGLGFPVVIYPFAYLEKSTINEIYEKDGEGIIPYRIVEKYREASAKLRELYEREFTAQLIEGLNIFYVALTRAIDELYIFLPKFKGHKKLPVPILEPRLEIGSPLIQTPKTLEQRKSHIYPPQVNEWQDKLYRPKINIDELRDTGRKKAKERGIFIHEFLAGIERLSEQWEEEIENRFGTLSQDKQEIIPILRDFFKREEMRKWFMLAPDISIYCEKEIVDESGQQYRVDRLLVWQDKVVVIEFKSGEPQSAQHQKQVNTYLRLLSKIYPDKTLEGWLLYVDELVSRKNE